MDNIALRILAGRAPETATVNLFINYNAVYMYLFILLVNEVIADNIKLNGSVHLF